MTAPPISWRGRGGGDLCAERGVNPFASGFGVVRSGRERIGGLTAAEAVAPWRNREETRQEEVGSSSVVTAFCENQ